MKLRCALRRTEFTEWCLTGGVPARYTGILNKPVPPVKLPFQTIFAVLIAAAVSGLRAAEFTVSNTNNAGVGSLRQAMLDANTNPGADRIVFNIPGDGLQSIRLTNALPALTDPVEIDGYTQPGSNPNTLADADNAVRLIELD